MTLSVNPDDLIELTQLEYLLKELVNHQEISIRLKLKSQPWPEHFSTVLVFARHAIVLTHMPTRTVTNIAKPVQVAAFEIDRPHKVFLPFRRYIVNPVCERLKGEKDGLLHA